MHEFRKVASRVSEALHDDSERPSMSMFFFFAAALMQMVTPFAVADSLP
jgi:hypothetical protein